MTDTRTRSWAELFEAAREYDVSVEAVRDELAARRDAGDEDA